MKFKSINKIISTVVLICFLFNTATFDYAFALSPMPASIQPDAQDEILGYAQGALAAKRRGDAPGQTAVIEEPMRSSASGKPSTSVTIPQQVKNMSALIITEDRVITRDLNHLDIFDIYTGQPVPHRQGIDSRGDFKNINGNLFVRDSNSNLSAYNLLSRDKEPVFSGYDAYYGFRIAGQYAAIRDKNYGISMMDMRRKLLNKNFAGITDAKLGFDLTYKYLVAVSSKGALSIFDVDTAAQIFSIEGFSEKDIFDIEGDSLFVLRDNELMEFNILTNSAVEGRRWDGVKDFQVTLSHIAIRYNDFSLEVFSRETGKRLPHMGYGNVKGEYGLSAKYLALLRESEKYPGNYQLDLYDIRPKNGSGPRGLKVSFACNRVQGSIFKLNERFVRFADDNGKLRLYDLNRNEIVEGITAMPEFEDGMDLDVERLSADKDGRLVIDTKMSNAARSSVDKIRRKESSAVSEQRLKTIDALKDQLDKLGAFIKVLEFTKGISGKVRFWKKKIDSLETDVMKKIIGYSKELGIDDTGMKMLMRANSIRLQELHAADPFFEPNKLREVMSEYCTAMTEEISVLRDAAKLIANVSDESGVIPIGELSSPDILPAELAKPTVSNISVSKNYFISQLGGYLRVMNISGKEPKVILEGIDAKEGFTHTSTHLAAKDEYGKLVVYELGSGKIVYSQDFCLEYSITDDLIMLTDIAGRFKVYELSSMQERKWFDGMDVSGGFRFDGYYAALRDREGLVTVKDMATGSIMLEKIPSSGIFEIALGRLAVIQNGELTLYSVKDKSIIKKFSHVKRFTEIGLNDNYLAFFDSAIYPPVLYDIAKDIELRASVQGVTAGFDKLRMSDKHLLLERSIVAQNNSLISTIWVLKLGTLKTIPCLDGIVVEHIFSPMGDYLKVLDRKNRLVVYDLNAGKIKEGLTALPVIAKDAKELPIEISDDGKNGIIVKLGAVGAVSSGRASASGLSKPAEMLKGNNEEIGTLVAAIDRHLPPSLARVMAERTLNIAVQYYDIEIEDLVEFVKEYSEEFVKDLPPPSNIEKEITEYIIAIPALVLALSLFDAWMTSTSYLSMPVLCSVSLFIPALAIVNTIIHFHYLPSYNKIRKDITGPGFEAEVRGHIIAKWGVRKEEAAPSDIGIRRSASGDAKDRKTEKVFDLTGEGDSLADIMKDLKPTDVVDDASADGNALVLDDPANGTAIEDVEQLVGESSLIERMKSELPPMTKKALAKRILELAGRYDVSPKALQKYAQIVSSKYDDNIFSYLAEDKVVSWGIKIIFPFIWLSGPFAAWCEGTSWIVGVATLFIAPLIFSIRPLAKKAAIRAADKNIRDYITSKAMIKDTLDYINMNGGVLKTDSVNNGYGNGNGASIRRSASGVTVPKGIVHKIQDVTRDIVRDGKNIGFATSVKSISTGDLVFITFTDRVDPSRIFRLEIAQRAKHGVYNVFGYVAPDFQRSRVFKTAYTKRELGIVASEVFVKTKEMAESRLSASGYRQLVKGKDEIFIMPGTPAAKALNDIPSPNEIARFYPVINELKVQPVEIYMHKAVVDTLADTVKEKIKELNKNIREFNAEEGRHVGPDAVTIKPFTSANLKKLLNNKNGNARRIFINDPLITDAKEAFEAILANEPELFRANRVITAKVENGASDAEYAVNQEWLTKVSILSVLLSPDNLNTIRPMLLAQLDGKIESDTGESVDINDYINRLAQEEGVDAGTASISARIKYFLGKTIKLTNLIAEQLRILKAFWTAA
ncbi:MAG: hypothetical protein Q7S30_06285 [Candidatus Omnitrophota bacterium]|nr:hypothetical protein [Candidatus Omnitrophota bacterium]